MNWLKCNRFKAAKQGFGFKTIPQNDGTFQFQAYSEARIMNGLLWLLLQHINGKTRDQLQQFNIRQFFDELGIASRLSETRFKWFKANRRNLAQSVIMYLIEPFF